MGSHMRRTRSSESGLALIISIMLLLLVSAMGIAAIDHSGSESTLGARERRTMTTFFGANAGIQLVMNRIAQTVPNVTPIDQNLANGTNVRTGTKADTVPQNVRVGATAARPPDGFMINQGSGGFVTLPFYAEITARGPTNATVELEAKLGRLEKR